MEKRYRLCIFGVCLLAAVSAAAVLLHRPQETAEVVTLYPDAYSREYYLNLCGWEVTPLAERDITVPTEFNETYAAYAQLQAKQGLPLRRFKGCSATLYTYAVENYGGEQPVRAELLISGGQLIAGSLYTAEQGGFQRGLRNES